MSAMFDRFCTFIEAGRSLPPEIHQAHQNDKVRFSRLMEALATAGFHGATVAELQRLIIHQRNYTETRKESTRLLEEMTGLMKKYGVAHPEFSHHALGPMIPVDDIRGQTLLYDMQQFEHEAREAARRLQKDQQPIVWN